MQCSECALIIGPKFTEIKPQKKECKRVRTQNTGLRMQLTRWIVMIHLPASDQHEHIYGAHTPRMYVPMYVCCVCFSLSASPLIMDPSVGTDSAARQDKNVLVEAGRKIGISGKPTSMRIRRTHIEACGRFATYGWARAATKPKQPPKAIQTLAPCNGPGRKAWKCRPTWQKPHRRPYGRLHKGSMCGILRVQVPKHD